MKDYKSNRKSICCLHSLVALFTFPQCHLALFMKKKKKATGIIHNDTLDLLLVKVLKVSLESSDLCHMDTKYCIFNYLEKLLKSCSRHSRNK